MSTKFRFTTFVISCHEINIFSSSFIIITWSSVWLKIGDCNNNNNAKKSNNNNNNTDNNNNNNNRNNNIYCMLYFPPG